MILLRNFGKAYIKQIEFLSRKLTDYETRWHFHEQELVAVVYALDRWIKIIILAVSLLRFGIKRPGQASRSPAP